MWGGKRRDHSRNTWTCQYWQDSDYRLLLEPCTNITYCWSVLLAILLDVLTIITLDTQYIKFDRFNSFTHAPALFRAGSDPISFEWNQLISGLLDQHRSHILVCRSQKSDLFLHLFLTLPSPERRHLKKMILWYVQLLTLPIWTVRVTLLLCSFRRGQRWQIV